jgi:integrase
VPKKYLTYKPPRIVKAKRWYVEYYYSVPVELREKYKRDWQRFRVFEDINRYKTDEYADLLRQMVEIALQDGYNPFAAELEAQEKDYPALEWTLNVALERFTEYCKEKGLRKKTIESYTSTINLLRDYFFKDNRIYKPLSELEKRDFKTMLVHYKRLNNWNPGTYNGYVSNLGIIFNWFVKEERLEKSPVKGLETLSAPVTRHRYYDSDTATKLKNAIRKADPYLYAFIEFIYYTATRPKSEARLLKIKHLLFDRSLIRVPGNIAKNKEGDHIPMSDELKARLIHLKGGNPEYYIWGTHGPAEKPAGQNHFANHFKPFKLKFGLGAEYTIYGFKHTRCIDLVKAGANAYDIMRLFRHSSLEQTQIYMKDLGLTDFSDLLKKGKKF